MKKNVILLITAAFVGAILSALVCTAIFCRDTQPEEAAQPSVPVETGIWSPKDWDNTYAAYLGDKVPTAEIALEIACDVLYGIEWGATPETGVPWYVFYDTEDGVWIVAFKSVDPDDPDLEFLGGGWYVAIQKSDGKILRIFADQ